MKAFKFFAAVGISLALACSPVWAQGRGGGGSHGGGSHGGGGGSHSSSVSHSSSSRGGGGYSGSSRSSSSVSSHSSSSSSRSSSYSRPSSSSVSHSSAPSRSSSPRVSGAPSSSRVSGAPSRPSSSRVSGAPSSSRVSGAPGRPSGSRVSDRPSGTVHSGREGGHPSSTRPAGVHRDAPVPPSGRVNHPSSRGGAPARVGDRPSGDRHPHYGTPGHPGPMPPSHRRIHPAPYFHHPIHHHMMHMHPVFWHPLPPRPIFWPGFWFYCNSYWYDYHVTDVVVVREYVREKYNTDLIAYAISGDYMYALIRDTDGKNYLQVFDRDDHLLAEQEVSRKYCRMEIDRENGGCWILKKNDKDPMLFIYAEGQLLIYEAD